MVFGKLASPVEGRNKSHGKNEVHGLTERSRKTIRYQDLQFIV